MRILIVSNLYPPDVLGGYELLARDIVERLRERGHNVSVLTTGSGAESECVIRTLVLARRFGDAAMSDRLRHVIAYMRNRASTRHFLQSATRPDVTLVMSLRRLGLAPLRELDRAGVPLVVTVNDDWPSFFADRPLKGLRDLPRRIVDRILASSRSFRDLPIKHVVYLSGAVRDHVLAAGVPLPRGRVLPQGVDLRVFTPRPHRQMRAEPTLLVVGRLHPSKAPEVALDTVAALGTRGTKVNLVMAGAPYDPVYGQSLHAQADRLGIGERVSWLGQVPREQLADLYRDADVLLFASKLEHEGQGLTYLEAMACGLPVIAYPTGGAREFLDRYPSVERVDALDGETFADAVQRLATNLDYQRELVEAGLSIIRKYGSIDTYVSELEGELVRACD